MSQKELFHADQRDYIDLKEISAKYGKYWYVFWSAWRYVEYLRLFTYTSLLLHTGFIALCF